MFVYPECVTPDISSSNTNGAWQSLTFAWVWFNCFNLSKSDNELNSAHLVNTAGADTCTCTSAVVKQFKPLFAQNVSLMRAKKSFEGDVTGFWISLSFMIVSCLVFYWVSNLVFWRVGPIKQDIWRNRCEFLWWHVACLWHFIDETVLNVFESVWTCSNSVSCPSPAVCR